MLLLILNFYNNRLIIELILKYQYYQYSFLLLMHFTFKTYLSVSNIQYIKAER